MIKRFGGGRKLALVKFLSPYNRLIGQDSINIDAENARQLCIEIIHKYGSKMKFLLTENGELSKNIIILINGKNAQTLSGGDTALTWDSEVVIMPYLAGG